ncbi:AraC family transcriptional regulator [Nevskia sp.]|uniref:AraC family transcriptional regulator n=1 Tax=Nevskia sp. TaxID=1929292 RepID=UPI0025E884C2|nr:AraC family transcriptional regulator [Nevskia sp.]
MTAHILAQLLDSPVLDAAAIGRFQALLQGEGCELTAMMQQGVQTPLRWFREVFPALDADQAARLGYAAGEQARLTSYSPLSLSLVSAATIHEALRLLVFLPLISNSLSAHLVEREQDAAIVLTAASGDPVLDRFPIFYCAAAVSRLLQLLTDQPVDLAIDIAWPRPVGFQPPSASDAIRFRFDAPRHQIVVPRATLQAACRFADPIAYQTELAGLQARMASLGIGDDITARLRRLLDSPRSLISIEEAAPKLHLSVSTLKRRLAEAGTSFRALRESVLQDRALLLLGDRSLSLDTIAGMLGYSDLANFSHAFKRWTGTSPGVFRRSASAAAIHEERRALAPQAAAGGVRYRTRARSTSGLR